MKTVTKLIVIIAAIPLVLILGFFGYLFMDIKDVENQSKDCKSISSKLEEYKKINGAYPKYLESFSIKKRLKDICNYQREGNGYMFVLTGSQINLQVYVYNSEQNTWHWD